MISYPSNRVHAYNSRMWEAETRESPPVQGWPAETPS